MTIQTFLTLLFAFSLITGLITEAYKKVIPAKFATNIVALCVAMVIGVAGMLIYYILNAVPVNLQNGIYMVLMGIANGVTAMVGYDKVMQTLAQLKK